MALRTEEQLYASVQRGMQAASDLSSVRPILEARKNDLIAKAIMAFNSLVPEKRLTDRDAVLFVAALAENQKLVDDLEAAVSDARRDHKALTS